MSKPPHPIRNGLLCALLSAAAMWASFPVAETGFIDDWSYIKTAQVFAHTGHFVYNGWGGAILGWQVVWGALFIKLFGFSFTVVRLSMLPVAMASVFLVYVILVRFEINERNAVFGTLTLGLSPLFLPLAASYMSDVPGLFVVLLCLYLCQRAVSADSANATIAWLCLAAATNVVGGTVRQIAWLGALVMIPSAGWLLRRRRGVLLSSALLWAASVAAIFLCTRWFARQPYSLPESVIKNIGAYPLAATVIVVIELTGSLLCLPLTVYPVLVAWLPRMRLLSSAALLRIALITLLSGLFEWLFNWTIPWLAPVLHTEFAVEKTGQLHWPGLLLLRCGRGIISLLVIATALIFLEQIRTVLWPQIKSQKKKHRTIPTGPWRDILWLLGPFTLSYFLLLISHAYYFMISDRYLLPILPIAVLCLLKLHQQWIAKTLPVISFIVLAVFALLAIAGTHDWFAWYRAGVTAANEIRATGVPRTEIQGGFEYDSWTQIEDGGHINDPRLVVPSGAYHPVTRPQSVPDACGLDFAPLTPAVHPEFSLVFAKKIGCLAPSAFPPVRYRTWLPPFHATIYVQTVPGAKP